MVEEIYCYRARVSLHPGSPHLYRPGSRRSRIHRGRAHLSRNPRELVPPQWNPPSDRRASVHLGCENPTCEADVPEQSTFEPHTLLGVWIHADLPLLTADLADILNMDTRERDHIHLCALYLVYVFYHQEILLLLFGLWYMKNCYISLVNSFFDTLSEYFEMGISQFQFLNRD